MIFKCTSELLFRSHFHHCSQENVVLSCTEHVNMQSEKHPHTCFIHLLPAVYTKNISVHPLFCSVIKYFKCLNPCHLWPYFRTEQQSTIIQSFIDRKWSLIMMMVLTFVVVNVCDEWISDWPYICWIGLECVLGEIMWEISSLAVIFSACSLFITETCGL